MFGDRSVRVLPRVPGVELALFLGTLLIVPRKPGLGGRGVKEKERDIQRGYLTFSKACASYDSWCLNLDL